jgi:hypothetical protein
MKPLAAEFLRSGPQEGPGTMTNILTPSRESSASAPGERITTKKQQLNQACIALDHAMKALDTSYQRKRAQILNGHGQDRSEL